MIDQQEVNKATSRVFDAMGNTVSLMSLQIGYLINLAERFSRRVDDLEIRLTELEAEIRREQRE